MPPHICPLLAEDSMINDVFRSLNDDGLLTPKQIAYTLDASERTGYRWTVDRMPTVQEFRRVLHAAVPGAQRRMLGYFLDGTAWALVPLHPKADINGDGAVNSDDVLDAAIHATNGAAQLLSEVRRSQKSGMRSISPADARVQLAQIDATLTATLAARNVIALLSGERHLAAAP